LRVRHRTRVNEGVWPTGLLLAYLSIAGALGVATPLPAAGQEIRAAGGLIGINTARQIWSAGIGPSGTSDARTGLAIGAFVEVAAPPSWLGVLAEATYSQRGAKLSSELTGSVPADVRSDYLVALVAPTVRWFSNPMGVSFGAGVSLEYLINTNAARELEIIYGNPTPVGLSGVVLAGGEYLHQERWLLRLEVRWFEGFRQAYTGDVADVRLRAAEAVLKVGRRPDTGRPPR
jgi:hypothetical protein